MPINASYEYFTAEKEYLNAKTTEEKIHTLEELIRVAPKHKGSENLLAELKLRLKKLKEKSEKIKKSSSGKKGIRKDGFQCVLIGFPNSGKSSLLSKLTNANPRISEFPFTTRAPEIGTMDYFGVKAQIIEIPSIGSENFDSSIVNTADCVIIVLENLSQLEKIKEHLKRTLGKKIIVINKSDLLNETEKRKLQETISSKKINGLLISSITNENINNLKEKIFLSMSAIRVYTKEPGKEKSPIPIVLPKNSSIKEVAEKILKGFSLKIKLTRLTGPSGKFPNQKVGLAHTLKDLDTIEFHTK